ncbi:MAG: prepilin-type N-terminal cleavage/methylation domain-containing protein [Nitrospinota bacterium]|nr:prepilin-type N-terminal cleavage/methylation domain-containing protein [Nitrospinota bacterium]
MNPKLKNESGFTLIELLIAAVIITGGMVTMASFMGGLVSKNSFNERKTMATVLAQEKVEELRNDALTTDLTAANNSTDTITTPAGPFARAWTIDASSNPNLITVTVSWQGTGGNTQARLVTLINN